MDHPIEPNFEQYHDDEIDLVDLARVIWRRKWVGLTFFLAVLIFGVAYALNTTPIYSFTTWIEPARILKPRHAGGFDNETVKPVEETILLLKDAIIPKILAGRRQENPSTPLPKVTIKPAKGRRPTPQILLTSLAPLSQSELVKELHLEVCRELGNLQDPMVKNFLADFEIKAENLHNQLTLIQNPAIIASKRFSITAKIDDQTNRRRENQAFLQVLHQKLAKLNDKETYTKKQIAAEQNYLKNAEQNRAQTLKMPLNESQAMTLLMIDNQMEQARQRLNSFDQSLLFELPEERQNLEKQILSLKLADEQLEKEIQDQQNQLAAFELQQQQEITKIQQNIERIKLDIDKTNLTTTLSQATMWPGAVKPNKKIIAALSGVLGLFGGLILIFSLEFIAKINYRPNRDRY